MSGFDIAIFDIPLIATELASDLRTIDIDCASIIATRRPLQRQYGKRPVRLRVYDFAFFALPHHRPSGAYVFVATMTDAVSSCAPRFFPTMMKIFRRRPLRKSSKALCKGATWHTALRASPASCA